MDVQIIQQNSNQPKPLTSQPSSNTPDPKITFFASKECSSEYRNQCLEMLRRIDQLQERVSRLQKLYQNLQKTHEHRQRKHRRRNSELQKSYKCIVQDCKKKYGSITSLKLHLRAKHGIKAKKKRLKEQIITLTNQ